ncbi:hypothetical protein KKA00_02160 [bacterium]|nr:hypothetical protein [bacterium]MBU1650997.1 hypothetical protein [bacterium]MBU1881374.1 hypothetical protein [bacterium]
MKDDCRPFMDRFCESLGEDPSSAICRELQEHLDKCPDCTLQVNTIKRTVELYQNMPQPLVPGDVQKRLLLRLNLPCGDK